MRLKQSIACVTLLLASAAAMAAPGASHGLRGEKASRADLTPIVIVDRTALTPIVIVDRTALTPIVIVDRIGFTPIIIIDR